MKRDMDLIRSIALELEKAPPRVSRWYPQGLDADRATLREHLDLMRDDGLIDVRIETALRKPWWISSIRLTNRGHDFLEGVRTQSRWQSAKDWFLEKGLPFTIQAVLSWAASRMQREGIE